MTISDRLFFLLLGCFIGFVLGYIVSQLRCIRREIHMNHNDDGLARRPVILNICLAIVVGLTVWASVVSQISSNRSNDAIDQVQRSDRVSCANANETRKANRALWDFIFEVSISNQKVEPPPRQAKFQDRLLKWIHKIYRKHDCSDLDKKYPIPDPPMIVDFSKHKKKQHN